MTLPRSEKLGFVPPRQRGAPLHGGALLVAMVTLVVSLVLAPREASAEPPVDTVVLHSGAKLRGTVMFDDGTAVSIKLLDGTSRTFKRTEVASIQYGEPPPAAPPPAAPAPPPLRVDPNPADPSGALGEAPRTRRRGPLRGGYDAPVEDEPTRKTGVPGVWITGITVFSAAYVTAILVTAATTDDNDRAKAIGYSFIPLFGGPASFAEEDFDIRSPYKELIIFDTVLQHVGMSMFIIGLSVPGKRRSTDVSVGFSGRSLAVSGSF